MIDTNPEQNPIEQPKPVPIPPVATEDEISETEIEGYDIAPDEKLWAALSYISFLCILTIVIKKDSKYCQFHSKQALILAIIFLFTKFFWMIRYTFPILALLELTMIIVGALRAYSGTWWKIPGIYNLSKSLKF